MLRAADAVTGDETEETQKDDADGGLHRHQYTHQENRPRY